MGGRVRFLGALPPAHAGRLPFEPAALRSLADDRQRAASEPRHALDQCRCSLFRDQPADVQDQPPFALPAGDKPRQVDPEVMGPGALGWKALRQRRIAQGIGNRQEKIAGRHQPLAPQSIGHPRQPAGRQHPASRPGDVVAVQGRHERNPERARKAQRGKPVGGEMGVDELRALPPQTLDEARNRPEPRAQVERIPQFRRNVPLVLQSHDQRPVARERLRVGANESLGQIEQRGAVDDDGRAPVVSQLIVRLRVHRAFVQRPSRRYKRLDGRERPLTRIGDSRG